MCEDAYVRCDNVRKIFDVGADMVEAIRSVTFSVDDGEFIAIVGPSGCGKSTLLMMTGGLETATSGSISIGGEPMTGPRTDIGIIFQDPTLLPWKSVIDNVLFPITIMRRPVGRYRDRARELLEMVGLGDFMARRPRQLSGGMRQRVAICRALIYEPRLLLMDEPFSALDAITRDEMNVALLNIWEHYKITAIFVTHSIREAVFLSDRVLVMSDRPSTFISEFQVPFERPREFSISETREFNEICGQIRERISHAHAGNSGGEA